MPTYACVAFGGMAIAVYFQITSNLALMYHTVNRPRGMFKDATDLWDSTVRQGAWAYRGASPRACMVFSGGYILAPKLCSNTNRKTTTCREPGPANYLGLRPGLARVTGYLGPVGLESLSQRSANYHL